MDTREFLNVLYGGLGGHAVLGTKDQYGMLDTERPFSLPRELENNFIVRYSDIRSGQDLYCSVAAFSTEKRTNSDTQAMTNVVWADADEAQPEVFKLAPSIVVATSPGRYHLFWVLDSPAKATEAQEMSRRIYEAHKDQGCDSGWTMTKYLRVPGTSNLKYDEPFGVVAEDTGLRYTLADFETAYPVEESHGEGTVEDYDRDTPPNPTDTEIDELEQRLPLDLQTIYTDVPPEGTSWSERAFRFYCDLFRYGFSEYEVFALSFRLACNKYAPQGWGHRTQTGQTIPKRHNWESVTWAEILKAQSVVEEEKHIPVPVVKDGYARFNVERPEFLSKTERDFVGSSPQNFLGEYLEMGKKFTGSAPIYHTHLATMVLSSVYGDLAHIDIPFLADKPLNLWGYILGDSTSSRKSTALRLAQDVISKYDEATTKTTYIGSDVTAEGLTRSLQGRDGQVSLVLVDEVSGLMKAMDSKKYQAGLQERLTELFDGRVPKTLRSSKEVIGDAGEQAQTCFLLWGAGVRERLTKILTTEDFESGFLMRSTFAVDRRTGYEPGSSAIKFQRNHPDMDPDVTARGRAESIATMAGRLSAQRATIMGIDDELHLAFDRETEDRFNTWLEQAHKYVQDAGISFAHSAIERLSNSVMKLACLLHLNSLVVSPGWDHRVVKLPSLLIALRQAENWIYDLLIVASEVTSSSFEERLNDIEDYLLGQPEKTATDADIRRRFASLRPREYSETMESLVKQGRVYYDMNAGTYRVFT